MAEVKRERKGSDVLVNGDDDGYEYDERLASEISSQLESQGHTSHPQSPTHHRRNERPSYGEVGHKSGKTSNLPDFRATAVFSDGGPSPLGM